MAHGQRRRGRIRGVDWSERRESGVEEGRAGKRKKRAMKKVRRNKVLGPVEVTVMTTDGVAVRMEGHGGAGAGGVKVVSNGGGEGLGGVEVTDGLTENEVCLKRPVVSELESTAGRNLVSAWVEGVTVAIAVEVEDNLGRVVASCGLRVADWAVTERSKDWVHGLSRVVPRVVRLCQVPEAMELDIRHGLAVVLKELYCLGQELLPLRKAGADEEDVTQGVG